MPNPCVTAEEQGVCQVCDDDLSEERAECWIQGRFVALGDDYTSFNDFPQLLEATTDLDQVLIEIGTTPEIIQIEVWKVGNNAIEPKLELWDELGNKFPDQICPEGGEIGTAEPPCASIEFVGSGDGCTDEEPCRYFAGISDDGHDDASPKNSDEGYVVHVHRLPEPSATALCVAALATLILLERLRR